MITLYYTYNNSYYSTLQRTISSFQEIFLTLVSGLSDMLPALQCVKDKRKIEAGFLWYLAMYGNSMKFDDKNYKLYYTLQTNLTQNS